MKKSMIMSLSLHHQSAIGLLASPRYTNGQRALRRTSWVAWKTSQHHFIFILITVIIILITIISIDIVIYHCINRHQPLYQSASRPTPRLYRGGRGALAFSFTITSSSLFLSPRVRRPGTSGAGGVRWHPTTIVIVFTVIVPLVTVVVITVIVSPPYSSSLPSLSHCHRHCHRPSWIID